MKLQKVIVYVNKWRSLNTYVYYTIQTVRNLFCHQIRTEDILITFALSQKKTYKCRIWNILCTYINVFFMFFIPVFWFKLKMRFFIKLDIERNNSESF